MLRVDPTAIPAAKAPPAHTVFAAGPGAVSRCDRGLSNGSWLRRVGRAPRGYRPRGTTADEADKILGDAKILEEAESALILAAVTVGTSVVAVTSAED